MADSPQMLRSWSVNNFKSVASAEIDLGPLTVLVGANSSGKSTLIQSILLLAQASRMIQPSDTIPLNGPLVRLGRLNELRAAHGNDSPVRLAGTFDASALGIGARALAADVVEAVVDLEGTPKTQQSAARVIHAELAASTPAGDVRISLGRRDPKESDQHALLEGAAVGGHAVDALPFYKGTVADPAGLHERIEGATVHGGVMTRPLVAESETRLFAQLWWQHHRSSRLSRSQPVIDGDIRELQQRINALERRLKSPLVESTRRQVVASLNAARASLDALAGRRFESASIEEKLEMLLDAAQDALREWRKQPLHLRVAVPASPQSHVAAALLSDAELRTRGEDFIERLEAREGPGAVVFVPSDSDWARLLSRSGQSVRTALSERVSYLGPLRLGPHDGGSSSGSPGDIGTRGENSAEVFAAERGRISDWPVPSGGTASCTLAEALKRWVLYLKLAEDVDSEDLGRAGVEFRVTPRSLKRPVDLTAVGVGVSQALPVLLRCLLAEPPSLVLLEQPELHLHPAVQQLLADFFIQCAESGRQLIVETHSEYLISRLRLRIAEDLTDARRELVRLLYVENPSGRTAFRQVNVTELGGLEAWPVGFFDQGPAEAQNILRAALQKRKQIEAERARDAVDPDKTQSQDVSGRL